MQNLFLNSLNLMALAHSLGCLSEASARRAYRELNLLYGQQETDEWLLQRPQVLQAALELVLHDLPMSRLAERLGLHRAHLQHLLQPLLSSH